MIARSLEVAHDRIPETTPLSFRVVIALVLENAVAMPCDGRDLLMTMRLKALEMRTTPALLSFALVPDLADRGAGTGCALPKSQQRKAKIVGSPTAHIFLCLASVVVLRLGCEESLNNSPRTTRQSPSGSRATRHRV
jgi:hypothetical protein